MKNLVFFLLMGIGAKSTFGQRIMHTNPYDIKKTNVSCLLFFKPAEVANAGPQLRVSHYFSPRIMLLFNGYYGLVSEDNSERNFTWGAKGESRKFFQNTFEADFHLKDFSKNKDVYINMSKGFADSLNQSFAFAKYSSSVRRAFCFTLGVQYETDTEKFKRNKDKELSNNEVPLTNINSGKDTVISFARIATTTSFTNLLVGVKFKAITATGVSHQNEKGYNDIHLETYCSLIIPVAYNYMRELYNNSSEAPTHRLHDNYSPKTGFRMGVFYRSSMHSNWCLGAELGVRPTILPDYWRGRFINLSLGLSLNFGKTKANI